MSKDTLERALQWLRKDDYKRTRYKWDDLREAVFNTIGTSERCFRDNKHSLIKLKWIKALYGSKGFLLTGKDVTGEIDADIQRRIEEGNKGRRADADIDDVQKISDTPNIPNEEKQLLDTDEFGNSTYAS
jgi:hypothetical protein